MRRVSRLTLLLGVVLVLLWLNTRRMLPKHHPSVEVQDDAGATDAPGEAVPRAEAKELKAGATLEGELESALRRALPSGPGGVLLLTFGDKGYRAAIHNFVAHAEAARAPHVVGAVDRETFKWFSARGTPSYLTALAHEAYQFDGSNAHASDAWARFAQMRTGEIARIVGMGYAVMHTDTDVVWLRDPTPYLLCDSELDAELSLRGASCAWLRQADVAVSSDNMSPGEDMRIGAAYAAGGERAHVQPPTRYDARTTHRSPAAAFTFLAALLGTPQPAPARALRPRSHPTLAPPMLAGTLNTGILFIRPTAAGRAFAARWHAIVKKPPPGLKYAGPGCCTSDQQVFGRMVRKNGYPGLAVPPGAPLRSRLLAADGNITLGALPLALFMNGHGYFVQHAHERTPPRGALMDAPGTHTGGWPLPPYAVHATYTLDLHDGVAKAQRFREAGLWRAEAPRPASTRYLALNSSVPPSVQSKLDEYVRRQMPASNIDVHLTALSAYVAELRDALALALALGRTLILPRWTCYCDRLWSGSDDIFHFGCMYPGSQDGQFVPFVCPMDHVLSPHAWQADAEQGVTATPHADAVLVEQLIASGTQPVELHIVPRAEHEALHAQPQGAQGLDALPAGVTGEEARGLLHHREDARILRLPHARGLLCGVDEPAKFNALAARLLRVPTWCSKCFDACDRELSKWLNPHAIKAASTSPNSVCFKPELPPAFSPNECVRNLRLR
jgi:hypothetical protein